MPGSQDQLSQELIFSQPVNILPESSSRFCPNTGLVHARVRASDSTACSVIQSRGFTPSQNLSENTWPNGGSIISSSAGPATHVAPEVLAETPRSSPRLASRTPPYQSRPQLCLGPVLLDGPSSVLGRYRPGVGLQKDGGLDRCLQHSLGSSVRGQTDNQLLVKHGEAEA